MMGDQHEDYEAWQRELIESLRPIDPPAFFWLGLSELDFREAVGHRRDQFSDELRRFVDDWLAGLDPNGGEATTEWAAAVSGSACARSRAAPTRGAGKRCQA